MEGKALDNEEFVGFLYYVGYCLQVLCGNGRTVGAWTHLADSFTGHGEAACDNTRQYGGAVLANHGAIADAPVLATDDSVAQLKLIFEQVNGHTASPELMAAAARAVVALSIPGADNTAAWGSFRSGVALRTVLGDIELGTVPAVRDAVAFSTALRKDGEALRVEVLASVSSGDATKLADCRKRVAGLATRSLVGVWMALLSLQAPPAAEKAAADPQASQAPPEQAEKTEADEAPTEAEAPAEALVAAPARALPAARQTKPVLFTGRVVGNKDSRKFHRPNCRFLPAPVNQVLLPDRSQALRQGFDPCRVCRP